MGAMVLSWEVASLRTTTDALDLHTRDLSIK